MVSLYHLYDSFRSLSNPFPLRYALAMRTTEPGDILGYLQHWLSFQTRFNEILPMIPIYSNIYFDFYNSQLRNYVITAHVTWTQAILQAYFGGEEEPEPAQDDGEEFIADD